MKQAMACLAALALCTAALAQGHDSPSLAKPMQAIAFLKGDWKGRQEFNTGGDPLVGEATNSVTEAISGRYLEERLSTALPGRKPSDTRHFVTFDPKADKYRAWWFNDSSNGAMELEGSLTGQRLVLVSKPTPTATGQSAVFRATYEGSEGKLVFRLELKEGEDWRPLFTTTYTKKG